MPHLSRQFFLGFFTLGFFVSLNCLAQATQKASEKSNVFQDRSMASQNETLQFLYSAGVAQAADAALDATASALLVNSVQPEKRKASLQKFLNEKIGFEALKNDYALIYEKHFSQGEISQLNRFFSSELGKKFIQKQPGISQEMAEVSQKKILDDQAELQKLISGPLNSSSKQKKKGSL